MPLAYYSLGEIILTTKPVSKEKAAGLRKETIFVSLLLIHVLLFVSHGLTGNSYDPRGLKGAGATYATSTMGADHTCGNALPSPANPEYDPMASRGQAQVSKFLQHYFAAIDSLGLCLFASLPILDDPALKQYIVGAIEAVLAEPLGEQFLETLGESVIRTERHFNECAGFTNKDDRLPDFFIRERLPESGSVFDVSEDDLDSIHN